MREILNNNDIRANNARKILFVLRSFEPCTKKDIAEKLNLSLPTITNITKILSAEELIEEKGNVESSVGRKPALVTLKNDARFGVGIHADTFTVSIGIVNFAGEIIYQKDTVKIYAGTEKYWRELSDMADEAIESSGIDKERIVGVNVAASMTLFPENWKTLHLTGNSVGIISRNEVPSFFHYPCKVDPVAVAAGIPRLWNKHQLENDLIVLMLSRNIETCFIQNINGYGQARSFSGGHLSINFEGKKCYCGKRGCIQTYCSTSVLIDEINGLDTSYEAIPGSETKAKVHWWDLVEQADAGNEEYAAMFDDYLEKLAYAIHNLHISFRADIVICGDITEIIAQHKAMLVEKIDRLSPVGESAAEYLHTSPLQKYQACIGAALNTFENVFSKL